MSSEKRADSVAVVGAGFAGMKAALDLAEVGVKVYLVDKKNSPGGTLADLERMFPSNNCAACTALPGNLSAGCQRQFSDAAAHPNIEFLGGTSFEAISGKAGSFKLKLTRLPENIIPEKCTGCGECIDLCPVTDLADGLLTGPIQKDFAQSCMPKTIKKGTVSPCREACPLGLNVPGFVQLVKLGRFLEAWKLVYNTIPFPSLCSHRCQQSCAGVCSGAGDQPVDVAALARFVTDYVYKNHYPELPLPEKAPERKEKVAVIGSEMAGLTAAYQLTRMGYHVSVFESTAQPGGMFYSKASPYLKKLLDKDISLLLRQGVEIHTGVLWGAGKPVERLLDSEYQLVLITSMTGVTFISRTGQIVSGGGEAPVSYQATAPGTALTLLSPPADGPSIYNIGLPGIFALQSPAQGSVHSDVALRAGQMAAEYIDACLSAGHGAGDFVPGENLNRLLHKAGPERKAMPAGARERGLEEKLFTPEGAMQEAGRCLNCGGGCVECGLCVENCPTDSIKLDAAQRSLELTVGAVIFAPGPDVFDPSALDYYGYGIMPNVVTGKEFERLLGDSTLMNKNLARPSDGQSPQKVAWIQCVGSRNKRHLEYCSAVCCQYAVKEAVMAKQLAPELETVIFGMDMRPYSSNGDEYWYAAQAQGVRFERTRIYNLEETDGNNIRIRYVREDGSICEDEYDLVVLSTGLKPNDLTAGSSRLLDISLDEYGFANTTEEAPCETNRKGILSAGFFSGPKDIVASVIDAGAAVMSALESLDSLIITPERKFKTFDADEEKRLGVFVCSCGGSIDKVISATELAKKAGDLPDVRTAAKIDFACLPDGLAEMKKLIRKNGLNRVILAGCTPRLRQREIGKALEEVNVLPTQLERVNIREQVAWVHLRDKPGASEKAFDLLRAGIRKALLAENSPAPARVVNSSLMIAGGTVGGLTAALSAAERGVRVYLVVKEDNLNESLAASGYHSASDTWNDYIARLVKKVGEHPLIELQLSARIISVSGKCGNFLTGVTTGPEQKKIPCGSVIMAGGTHRQGNNLWLSKGMVKSHEEFGDILDKAGSLKLDSVVFLPPFVPGAEEFTNYTRAGCKVALQNAVRAKECFPGLNIYFLYRDMLVFGKDEKLYNRARRKGIIFIRFDYGFSPEIREAEQGLQVKVNDNILGAPIVINPDLLVVEAPSAPDFENMVQAGLFGLQLRKDGYFQEANEKYKPLETNVTGVYLCGLARGPVPVNEEIVQGKAAAMEALTFLTKEHPYLNRHVARVTEKWCNGCGLCVSACPSGARSIDQETRVAVVDQTMCLGCGACQAACRSAATHQVNFSKKQILEVIDEFLN